LTTEDDFFLPPNALVSECLSDGESVRLTATDTNEKVAVVKAPQEKLVGDKRPREDDRSLFAIPKSSGVNKRNAKVEHKSSLKVPPPLPLPVAIINKNKVVPKIVKFD
jgi:hypothetical protein